MLGKLIRAFFNKEKITKFRRISFLSSFLNSTIGAFSKVYSFCKISDAKIGSYTYVSYWCIVNNCEIGNYCSLARGVKIGLGRHPSDFISTSPIFYSTQNPLSNVFVAQQKFTEFEKTIIGNDVWIGVNALILDGVKIGDGAIVGANAVVTKDVPPFAIVGGSPAKIIRYRFSDDIIEKLLKTKWWDKEIGELQSSIALFQQPVSEEIINKLTNGNA